MRKKSKGLKGDRRQLVESAPFRTTGGGFWAGLTETDAEYESRNELHALLTLVLCHDVQRVSSQPQGDSYVLDGKEHKYTPDFIVDAFEPGLRLEVKSIGYLAPRESDWEKYQAIAKAYQERQVPFAFLVDAQLEEQPRFDNVKLLSRYIGGKAPCGVKERVVAAVSAGAQRVQHLMDEAQSELIDILTLVANKTLTIDWSVRFNRETSIVSLPGQPLEGLKLEHILSSSRYGDFLEALALGHRTPDKRILEAAKTWRQPGYNFDVFTVVGGSPPKKITGPIADAEPIPRDYARRRDFAPGRSNRTPGKDVRGGAQ